MECGHLFISFLLLLKLSGLIQATLPQEEYWTSELPMTPIPDSIRYMLPHAESRSSIYRCQTELGVIDEAYLDRAYVIPKKERSDKTDPSLFFLEKELRVGNTMTGLQFIKVTNPAVFIPRKVARLFPFSSKRLGEVLNLFSVETGSVEADLINKTLNQCEIRPAFGDEKRQCVTSLESMVDYVKAQLGRDVRAITTRVDRATQSGHQNYTIGENMGVLKGSRSAVCHKLEYPYAVYQCHDFDPSKAHVVRVPLKGSDATETEALAVCHYYAYLWEPLFVEITNMLKPRPGVDHVCHFLAQDTVVWEARKV